MQNQPECSQLPELDADEQLPNIHFLATDARAGVSAETTIDLIEVLLPTTGAWAARVADHIAEHRLGVLDADEAVR